MKFFDKKASGDNLTCFSFLGDLEQAAWSRIRFPIPDIAKPRIQKHWKKKKENSFSTGWGGVGEGRDPCLT
jgi:hypothetical protein